MEVPSEGSVTWTLSPASASWVSVGSFEEEEWVSDRVPVESVIFCSPIIRPLVSDGFESADGLPPASQPTRKGFVFSSVRIGREFSENAVDRAIDSTTKPIHPGVINRVLTTAENGNCRSIRKDRRECRPGASNADGHGLDLARKSHSPLRNFRKKADRIGCAVRTLSRH